MEKVSQACEQVLLLLLLGFVGKHVLPERPAEVEGLQHRVAVARVSELGRDGDGGAESNQELRYRPGVLLVCNTCIHIKFNVF